MRVMAGSCWPGLAVAVWLALPCGTASAQSDAGPYPDIPRKMLRYRDPSGNVITLMDPVGAKVRTLDSAFRQSTDPDVQRYYPQLRPVLVAQPGPANPLEALKLMKQMAREEEERTAREDARVAAPVPDDPFASFDNPAGRSWVSVATIDGIEPAAFDRGRLARVGNARITDVRYPSGRVSTLLVDCTTRSIAEVATWRGIPVFADGGRTQPRTLGRKLADAMCTATTRGAPVQQAGK